MGGTVTMASKIGQGTTMSLSLLLPIADPELLPKHPEDAPDMLATIPNMRRMAPSVADAEREGTLVLVVDDHPTNRLLLARQVQALGYAAESVENGLEALKKWNSGRFGIVITDCNMPEMDGFELTRNIRSAELLQGIRRTPVISCTANALGAESERCLAAGMDDCLVKPVALSQILKKLDQWLPIPEAATADAKASERRDASTTTPFDRSVLAEISGGDPSIERDILAEFRKANDQDAADLTRAMADDDFVQMVKSSHRMVGASRVIGALRFADLCQRISRSGHARDSLAVASDMAMFHDEYNYLNHYLDTL
jgi:CheY-like chemotaxis protein/HPt (histidine-containing phosphotransfer) domain-containing protein